MAMESASRLVLVTFLLFTFVLTTQAQNCPDGWVHYAPGNICIYLSQDKRDIKEASAKCAYHSGELVKITDKQMDAFLYSQMKDTGIGHFIGLNDRKKEGKFMWNDCDSKPNYLNWEAGQPNNWRGQDCVVMRHQDGTWSDIPCRRKRRFICQKQPMNCPAEWIKYYPANTCIYLSQDKQNFDSAVASCKALHGKLIRIPDSNMDAFLHSKIKETGLGHYIGLNDRMEEGKFTWNDETSEPCYVNWEPGQPNGQDCVTLRNKDGFWNDSPCGENKRFICQKAPKFELD